MRWTRAPGVLLILVGWLLLDSTAAHGHELGVVRVRLIEIGTAVYALEARLPLVSEFASRLPVFPSRCRVSSAPRLQTRPAWIDLRMEFACEAARLTDADTIILPWPNHAAFFSADFRGAPAAAGFFPGIEEGSRVPLGVVMGGAARTTAQIARHYVALGIEHILTGWDHLAFVLMLCLIASEWRLLGLVSIFTVGHSLTLALAALGLVRVSVAPIEATIALSVAFLAREALREDESPLSHGAILVFGFGLLHGLGFASALGDAGIGRTEFYVGLITFNLGVEIGQLAFVWFVIGLVVAGRSFGLSEWRRVTIRSAVAYGVGALGVYWLLQRAL